jgi:hypothetical protein
MSFSRGDRLRGRNLADHWPQMDVEEKRRTVETITQKIEIGKRGITITFYYLPNGNELPKR